MQIPPLHILIYGEPFVGKSQFNRSMPTPHLIFFFDPSGKDVPYLSLGTVQDTHDDGTPMLNSVGCPMKRVWKDDQLLIQIEYFHETNWIANPATGGLIPVPQAYELFCKRMVTINEDCSLFKTISIDSLTYLELDMRLRERYKINPGAKDARQWYAGARNEIEQMIMSRFGSLSTNIVVICHEKISENEITKEIIRSVLVVGTLGQNLPVGFSEMYHMRNETPGKGRFLQTQKDGMWPANSIYAPNPCQPDYQSVIASIKGD